MQPDLGEAERVSGTVTRDSIVNHSLFVVHEDFPARTEGNRNKISGVYIILYGCSTGRY